jgi:hypothetical protein
VVASQYCGRRTVFYRLDSRHRAGFEPELVWWGLKTGAEWDAYDANFIRHIEDDLVAEMVAYRRRPVVSRLLHRQVGPHPDMLEDTSKYFSERDAPSKCRSRGCRHPTSW